jgi:hypothetical protein
MANATKDPPLLPSLTAAGDPVSPPATPLILNDGYFELGGVNLSCLVKHLEAPFAENKPVTVTTFCSEVDYPGVTKYHLRATLYQTFDPGATFATLNSALQAYNANGTAVNWKARAHASRIASANNPIISGMVIPQPFDYIVGDAGAAAEVAIDWLLTGAPTVDNGSVAATGAQSGAPGYYTPSGASVPANLAGLAAVTATPAAAWATGSYVITADLLAAHWSGSAWAAGKA